MDKKLLLAHLNLFQYANLYQIFQVTRCSLTLSNFLFDHIADTAIRLLENHIHQFARVGFRQLLTHKLQGVFGQCTDGCNLGRRPASGLFYRA